MNPQPKPYDQARKEAFADHVANSGGRSEYMQVDFDAGFSAGYNAALHDRERELRERAAIAAMQGILGNPNRELVAVDEPSTAHLSILCADALINQLNNQES